MYTCAHAHLNNGNLQTLAVLELSESHKHANIYLHTNTQHTHARTHAHLDDSNLQTLAILELCELNVYAYMHLHTHTEHTHSTHITLTHTHTHTNTQLNNSNL